MSTFVKNCPFCTEEIAVDAIKCEHCGSLLDGAAGTAPVFDYPPTILTVPIIVSAVWNVMTAIGWTALVPCVGLVVAVPYCVLAYFEITTFLRAPAMPPDELHRRCGPLGICQIVLGIFNILPVVCGILVLVYRDRLRQYRGEPQGSIW